MNAMRISMVIVMVGLLAHLSAAAGPSIPDGLKGFVGVIEGTVVERAEGDKGVFIRVTAVKPAADSKAPNPQAAVGKTVLINAQWAKGEGDKWHPVEAHIRYIKSLERNQQVRIPVINDEGERLHIQSL